jgi:hypothetical protein
MTNEDKIRKAMNPLEEDMWDIDAEFQFLMENPKVRDLAGQRRVEFLEEVASIRMAYFNNLLELKDKYDKIQVEEIYKLI